MAPMSEPADKPDFTRFAATGLPTPDAMMTALFEQQKILSEKDELLAESQSQIQSQRKRFILPIHCKASFRRPDCGKQ